MMEKYRKVKRVLIIILIANVLVAGVKLGLGYLLKVNSITADGLHALSDSTSNIVGLIAISFASAPADKHHHYGHEKFETIASFIIGMMLFIITLEIFRNAIAWFVEPVTPEVSIVSILIMGGTLVLNSFVALIEYKEGKKLNSEVLISDSIHTKSDVLITFGVIVSLILIKLGAPAIIDPIISLIIGIYVLRSSIHIFRGSIGILVDQNVYDKDEIKKMLIEDINGYNQGNKVCDIHKIRNRGRSDKLYVDFHMVLRDDVSIEEVHNMTHYLEERLNKRLGKSVEIFAHIEPCEFEV